MNKYHFFIVLFLCVSSIGFSQSKNKDVLLTIEDEPVYFDEFLRIYQKNIDLVQDEKQKDKIAYLDLFVNYKLKIKEAFAQQLDQNPTFIKELDAYKNQLANTYLYQQEITEALTQEAYQRLQEEINANHILIRLSATPSPKDTLEAYQKIVEIREKALAGDNFEELAKQFSEEPNANERAGALGYFKGLDMVYPFEEIAYATPVGAISEIVRTQYGYHVIKINNRRPVPNEVTVAHIMVAKNKEKEQEELPKRINEIYNRALQGEDFGDLAKQFSEDPGTSKNGGQLNRFGSGRLNAPEFEEVAFNLKNKGDISKPVETKFGWHIIKLIERHPKETFEEAKDDLLKRLKNSDRSKMIVASVNDQIKKKYNFREIENPIPFFNNFVTDSILKRKWKKTSHPPKLNTVAFEIGERKVTFLDFANFIEEHQKKGTLSKSKEQQLIDYYEAFQEKTLDEFYKINLEKENEEYANLVEEYRDGLLIFDLMQKNIWEKSKNDTLGLENFFNTQQRNYKWNTRVKGLIASTSSMEVANQIKAMLESGKDETAIKEAFNTEQKTQVIFTSDTFELGNSIIPNQYEPQIGVSQVFDISSAKHTEKPQFIVVKANDIMPPQFKDLTEVRGKVMSDYQSFLENEWMQNLRDKYAYTIHKKAFKRLQKM